MGDQTLLASVLWHVRSWDEIKQTSLFTLANYANIFLLLGFVIFAIIQARSKIVRDATAVMISFYPLSRLSVLTNVLVPSKRSTQRRMVVGWKRLASHP
jgi:predicted membrane channel-forming protein YqfA (hemolysin III family)